MMNCRFMPMILKPNINLRSGSMHLCHNQKSMSKSEQCQVNADYFFFFDDKALVHHEYTPKGQTINEEYYLPSYETIT